MTKTIILTITTILLFISTQFAYSQKKYHSKRSKPLICSDCFPVNEKPLYLPVPEYPKAARAVNASGTVQVQILIDEKGNVICANPTSGHPLLWQASAKSALQAKFNPILLRGKPIMVTGVIVYNFVSDLPDQGNQLKEH